MNRNEHIFHLNTFRLLGFEPSFSAATEHAVADAEGRLGTALPQSVRDWYCREGAIRILAEHSNDDPPITVERFEIVEWQSRRLLPLRNENQGVCTWAVELNGSEDPPVFVDVDSGGKEWQLLSPRFSEYVYSSIWDYRMVLHRPALVQAQNGALSETTLCALRVCFREEVQTHGWPGSAQHRFANESGGILIWASERQADWFIGASDANGLEAVVRKVWNLDEVGTALYDISEIGKTVLSRVRGAVRLDGLARGAGREASGTGERQPDTF